MSGAASVTIVIPTYNAEKYLPETLQSVYDQTLPQSRITIIVVDDGSTDGSPALLQRHAAERDNLVMIAQPHSGSASGPRNAGIERATGDFLFFLDADDLLTPRALERMVDVADEHDADVVLCRMEPLNGRRGVPQSMFKQSHMDADVVDQQLFFALGPTKLFRRTHLLEHELRFPTSLSVGEDKPMVAAALLTSRRTCIVAEEPYYLVRERDEPSEHMSRGPETIEQALHKAELLANVIERYTDPGDRRDRMLRRAFGGSFQGAFRRKLVARSETEREALVERARSSLGHLWTEGVRAGIPAEGRVVLDLAFAGRIAELVELEGWRAETPAAGVRATDGRWTLPLPDSVVAALPPGADVVEPPTVHYRLTSMVEGADGGLLLRGYAGVTATTQPPDAVLIELLHRTGGQVVEVVAAAGTALTNGTARLFEAEIVPSQLSRGVWDAHLVLTVAGSRSARRRLGSQRAASVPAAGLLVGDDSIAYFTSTYSNLSIDRGFTVRPRPPTVTIVGADRDASGRVQLYLDTRGVVAAALRIEVESRRSLGRGVPRQQAPVPVGPHLVRVGLPEPAHRSTALSIAAVTASGDRSAVVPPSGLRIPHHPAGGSADVIEGAIVVGPGASARARSPIAWAGSGRRFAARAARAALRRLPAPVAAAARRMRARVNNH